MRVALYYSTSDGLMALDLSTLHEREPKRNLVLPHTPEYRPECWGVTVVKPRHSLPLRWEEPDQRLLLRSEAGCGFEANAESWLKLLWGVTPTGVERVELLSPVTTVRADHRGQLWLGDGEICSSSANLAPSSRGTLWRSRDGGARWAAVQLRNGDVTADHGIVQLDLRGNTLVALTSRCTEMIPGGGNVWWSHDLGKSWDVAAANEELFPKDEEADGPRFDRIQLLSARPLRVRAFRDDETWQATLTSRPRRTPRSRPKGVPWKRIAQAPRPPATDTEARLGAITFHATRRGLQRSDTRQIVFRTVDYLRAFHRPLGPEELSPPLAQVQAPWVTGSVSRATLALTRQTELFRETGFATGFVASIAPSPDRPRCSSRVRRHLALDDSGCQQKSHSCAVRSDRARCLVVLGRQRMRLTESIVHAPRVGSIRAEIRRVGLASLSLLPSEVSLSWSPLSWHRSWVPPEVPVDTGRLCSAGSLPTFPGFVAPRAFATKDLEQASDFLDLTVGERDRVAQLLIKLEAELRESVSQPPAQSGLG